MKKSSDLCNHKESIPAILHSLEKGIFWLCKFSVLIPEPPVFTRDLTAHIQTVIVYRLRIFPGPCLIRSSNISIGWYRFCNWKGRQTMFRYSNPPYWPLVWPWRLYRQGPRILAISIFQDVPPAIASGFSSKKLPSLSPARKSLMTAIHGQRRVGATLISIERLYL